MLAEAVANPKWDPSYILQEKPRCEICPEQRACGHYCKAHHYMVCVMGASPKAIVEVEQLMATRGGYDPVS